MEGTWRLPAHARRLRAAAGGRPVPVGYDTPRKLAALAGVACAIYGFLNLNLLFIGIGAALLGYFALIER